MTRRLFWLVGLVLLGLLASTLWYGRIHAPESNLETRSVRLIGPTGQVVHLDVELADEEGEWERGLMGREVLAEGAGMMFLFPDSRPRSFWMKNTLIPLDILYFDEGGIFISRTTMTPCESDPCQQYPSDGPAMFALEVNRAEDLTESVGSGWAIDIDR